MLREPYDPRDAQVFRAPGITETSDDHDYRMGHAILLALAGLMSGTLAALPGLGGGQGAIAAGVLGVVLAAYLWLHAGVRSPGRLAVVVFAAIVGYYIMMFVGFAGLFFMAIQRNHGLTPTFAMAPAAAVGAALIAVVFLQVLPSKRDQLGLEIACCAIAGGLAGLLWGFGEFATVQWLVRLQAWNGAVAGALGLVAHLRSRPAPTNTTTLRLLAGAGLAGVCALLVFGDALRAAAPHSVPVVVESSYGAVDREARLKSLSEAPPSVDLPAIPPVPAPGMFMPGRIAGFVCFPPTDDALPPDTTAVDSMELRVPARHQYTCSVTRKKRDRISLRHCTSISFNTRMRRGRGTT